MQKSGTNIIQQLTGQWNRERSSDSHRLTWLVEACCAHSWGEVIRARNGPEHVGDAATLGESDLFAPDWQDAAVVTVFPHAYGTCPAHPRALPMLRQVREHHVAASDSLPRLAHENSE